MIFIESVIKYSVVQSYIFGNIVWVQRKNMRGGGSPGCIGQQRSNHEVSNLFSIFIICYLIWVVDLSFNNILKDI